MNEYTRLRRRLRDAMATPDTLTGAAGPLADILDEALGALARDLDPQRPGPKNIAGAARRFGGTVERRRYEGPAPTAGDVIERVGVEPAPEASGDEVTRAAAEIDRLARDGTPCLVVGERYSEAVYALHAHGWAWVPQRSEMVRDGAVPIRVAWTSAAIRGPNCGTLWLAGASASQATEARQALRRPPGTTITTGLADQSDPLGVDPTILETDKTDPPCGPVLPPGCRLSVTPEGWAFVLGRHGALPLSITSDQGEAVRNAWKAFGAFMSREDYEDLVASEAAGRDHGVRLDIVTAERQRVRATGMDRLGLAGGLVET